MSLQTAIATLDQKKQAILAVIPKTLRGEMEYQQIRQSIATAIRGNEKLGECSPMSIYTSAMYITRLGLEIGGHGGEAFLVPFAGVCTPMIGVRGKEVLAIRSGHVQRIMSGVIHENDIHRHDLADGSLSHQIDFTKSDRGRPLAAWARVWLRGSPEPILELMTEGDFQKIVEGVKKKNRGKLSPSYAAWPDEMRRNRVLSRALKRVPKSKDIARVLSDETTLDHGSVAISDDGLVDVENAPVATYEDPEDFAEETKPKPKRKPRKKKNTAPPGDDDRPSPPTDSGMP